MKKNNGRFPWINEKKSDDLISRSKLIKAIEQSKLYKFLDEEELSDLRDVIDGIAAE